jgi:hypothetical protein
MSRSLSKYFLPMLFIYFILTGMLFIINDYSVSFIMPIAPVVYGMCFGIVCFKRPSALGSISVLIIYAMSFLRMVLVPVIYVMSGYVSTIETSAGIQYLDEAVILVCFELFCITLLVLSSKKLSRINCNIINDDLDSNIKIKLLVKIILFCLVLVGVLCVLLDKSVLVILSTIFDRFTATTEMNIERRRAYLSTRENSSLVFNLFSQVVFYLQILIPASLISYATNKRNELNSNKGFALGLIISALSVLFITDNNIDSVCIMIACLLVLFSVYYERMSRILPFILIVVASFIAMFLFSKVGLQSGGGIKLDDLSRVLCAYFSAFPNVSCGFTVQYDDKLATFWGDIVAGVPYMMAFFRGYPKSVTLFNIAAHGYTGLTNQIMPLISYGYQYLWIFAPSFTLIVYNIAFGLEVKFRNTNKTFNRVLYALMFINLSVGPCIFGFPNTIKRLCYYVPLLILANLNGDSDRFVR